MALYWSFLLPSFVCLAFTCFNQCFLKSCGETRKRTVEYHFLRGFMYRNCGNFPKAKEQYLNVLRQSPNHRSAKRELVALYTGLEDYESAYEYAKDNYEKESENVYYIQSYFEVMIHMPDAIMQEHMAQIEEMVETIGRINKNKPTDFYYQINALYSAYIEKDEERTLGLLAEGAKRFSHSLYISEAQSPVFPMLKWSRCRSSQEVNGSPTPFCTLIYP